MALFGRKKVSPEAPTPLSEEPITSEPLIVEPTQEWLNRAELTSQIKFVRRGHIVLVAIATSSIDHYAISRGRPDLEPRFAAMEDDSVADAGYLRLDRDEDRDWDVKVDQFSGTYARGDRAARHMSAEVLRGYLPDLIVTTDDELNET